MKKRSDWMRGLLDAERMYKSGDTWPSILVYARGEEHNEAPDWFYGMYAAAMHYTSTLRVTDVHPN